MFYQDPFYKAIMTGRIVSGTLKLTDGFPHIKTPKDLQETKGLLYLSSCDWM